MKKWPAKQRIPLLFLIILLPFGLDVLLYSNGVVDNLFLRPLIVCGLTYLTYTGCSSVGGFLGMQFFMLLCQFLSGAASTYLYYRNISDDWATPVAGKLVTLVGAGLIIMISIVTGLIKYYRKTRCA